MSNIWITWVAPLTSLAFIMALGACVGSFLNVVVYRLPLGLKLATPPSRCPSCDTRLTWRENVPIIGWLALRGRCRFCKSRISAEYPLIEALTAVLFGGLWALWYVVPAGSEFMGLPIGSIRPDWAHVDLWRGEARPFPIETWPQALILMTLVACLLAATLIDARTFMIPLIVCWIPAAVAVVVHPLHALLLELQHGPLVEQLPSVGWRFDDGRPWLTAATADWSAVWTIPSGSLSDYGFVLLGVGGVAGLGVSLVLQKLGLIRQSFAGYDAWEDQAIADAKAQAIAEGKPDPTDEAAGAELWIQYPYARREMITELAFVGPAVLLGMLGWWFGTTQIDAGSMPLWLNALGGSLVGLLGGGAVIWAFRIFGTLAFGKEALGLGDVHLIAGVGACLGWIDPVLALVAAAFLGLIGHVVLAIIRRGAAPALPFGPWLAGGTLLVILGKIWIEQGLSSLAVRVIDLT